MKKNTLSLMAVLGLAMTIASCSSDLVEEKTNTTEKQQMVFTATYEDTGETTRTALNGTNVEWQNGDYVAVWDGTATNSFAVTPGSNKTTATLTGSVTKGSTSFTAVYPYSLGDGEICDYTNEIINLIRIPNEQTATLNSFDPEAAVMVAKSDDNNNFTFKNVCSFLKITTADEYQKIVVTTNDGTLAGTGSCANSSEPTFTVMRGYSNSQVTLLPKSGSSTIAKGTYYIAIAPGKLEGLTVDCYINREYVEKSTSSVFTTVRSKSYDLGLTENWTRKVDENILVGAFSVSDTKQVQFTKGNLYWNGSAYHLEDTQIASSMSTSEENKSWVGNGVAYDPNHVSHFFWTTAKDYQSGTATFMPYAKTYAKSSVSFADKFWCGIDNPLDVDGTSNLYTLTSDEWKYLLGTNSKRNGKYEYGVTVTIGSNTLKNCLVIAPDNCLNGYTFDNTKQTYSADEWTTAEAAGLVCLPSGGGRYYLTKTNPSALCDGKILCCYWSSTVSTEFVDNGNVLVVYPKDADGSYIGFDPSTPNYINPSNYDQREYGFSIRLVKTY